MTGGNAGDNDNKSNQLERANKAIEYLSVLQNRASSEREAKQRLFRFYLLIVGGSLLALPTILQFFDRLPTQEIGFAGLVMAFVGAMLLAQEFRQTLRDKQLDRKLFEYEQFIEKATLDKKFPNTEDEFGAPGAVYAVYMAINSTWAALGWYLLSLSATTSATREPTTPKATSLIEEGWIAFFVAIAFQACLLLLGKLSFRDRIKKHHKEDTNKTSRKG